MQFKQSITMEELKRDSDPLGNAYHPLGKLKLVSDVIGNVFSGDNSDLVVTFNPDGLFAINEIISDAVEEIELLIEISNEQFNAMERDLKELKASQAEGVKF